MTLPFEILTLSLREVGLVVAVLIGFGFGFVLERAGFGVATKLAAQFYLHDMTVFKVMFSAIVTAMLGLTIFAGLGVVDLSSVSQSIASWTWIWPMLVGGLVLGAGFIISGYCPGTSLVAAASGKIDGMFTVIGVAAGSFAYSFLLEIPEFAKWHTSGELGPEFLYELLGIPAPVLALGVTLMAIGAFVGAEKVEAIMRRKREGLAETPTPVVRPRRLAFATFGVLAAFAVALLAVPWRTGAAPAAKASPITVQDLARRLVDEPWTVRVIDLRPADEFAKAQIPGSENVAPSQLGDLGLQYAPASKAIVVVGNNAHVPAPVMAYQGEVRVLAGGWNAWKAYAIDAPPPLAADASREKHDDYMFQSSLRAALTGAKAAPVQAAPATGYVPKPKKKGGGCSA